MPMAALRADDIGIHHSLERRRLGKSWTPRNKFKCRITTSATELYSCGEARLAPGAHHDGGVDGPGSTIKAAAF